MISSSFQWKPSFPKSMQRLLCSFPQICWQTHKGGGTGNAVTIYYFRARCKWAHSYACTQHLNYPPCRLSLHDGAFEQIQIYRDFSPALQIHSLNRAFLLLWQQSHIGLLAFITLQGWMQMTSAENDRGFRHLLLLEKGYFIGTGPSGPKSRRSRGWPIALCCPTHTAEPASAWN